MPLLGLILLVLPMPNLVPFKDLVSAVIVVVIIIPISVLRSMVTSIGLMTTKLVCMAPKATCTITQGKTNFPIPSAHLCDSDTLPGIGSNTWIINTSSSDHMTCDDKLFDESSSNPLDLYITNVNGLPLLVTGEGTIHPTLSLSLSHALMVPNIHCNLLSIGCLLETFNLFVIFYSSLFFPGSQVSRDDWIW